MKANLERAMFNSNNILNTILNDYPDVWKNLNKFKNLLMDYLPQDKLRRNLLCICVKEKIPDDLYGKDQVNNADFYHLKKRIIEGYGCSGTLAEEIIAMWIEAMGIRVTNISGSYSLREIPVDNNDLDSLLEETNRNGNEKQEEDEDDDKEILAQWRSIQMSFELEQAVEKYKIKDYAGSLVHFEKAVELGYRGNYSVIGLLYIEAKDYEKSFEWWQRFYNDFKNDDLELDDNSMMTDVCGFLGAFYFVELQKEKCSTILKQYKVKRTLDLWKEAIDYASEKDKNDSKSNAYTANNLFILGYCFYYGEIRVADVESLKIPPDYEYAYKAFSEAEKLGDIDAMALLAKMYEEGKYVRKDDVVASNKYLKAAMNGNENAIEWCQKNYLDKLSWKKQSDWSNVDVAVEFPEIIAKLAKQIGCNNLEELRNFRFENLKNVAMSTKEEDLRELFVYVTDFVENYEASPVQNDEVKQ